MKRLFFAMAAMAAMLTSCSKDETTTAPVIERSKVTFTVNAPELATRADEGNGKTATQLEYVIYDLAESPENGANQIKGTATFENGSLTTTVTVDLVEDRTYEAIFFAQSPEKPYEFNYTARTMTIKNPSALVANKEEYDAFFKFIDDFTVQPTGTVVDVKMTRPFAQLNIGTNDFQTQAGSMIDANNVQVKVSEVYKTLNLQTGAATDPVELTFAFAPKMDGTINAAGKEYDWLSMNYLLVNTRAVEGASKLIDVEFLFTDEPKNNEQNPLVRNYTSVPVERNYRTNIVGSILTSSTKFNVEILPGFEDDKDGVDPKNVWDGETYDALTADADGWYSVSHAAEFAWILKNKTSHIKISLEADIDFGGHQLEYDTKRYDNVTINGNGNRILNFVKLNSTVSRAADTAARTGLFSDVATATVSNLTIEGADVDAGVGGSAYAGALFGRTYGTIKLTNVTVKDSEVAGTNKVGGLIGFVAENDIVIENCRVIDTDITTHDVETESGSAGGFIGCIMNNATISNSSVKGGVFNVINSEGNASRANSKFIGVVGNGKVELINCSVDETGMTYNEEANGYTSPYGDLVGGNRGSAVVTINGATAIASAESLAAALTANEEVINITLGTNIDVPISSLGQQTGGSGEYKLGGENTKKITIDLNSHKLNIKTTYWSNIGAKNPNALFTIKNGTMTSSQSSGTWNSYDLSFANCNYVIENVVFDKAIAFGNAGKSVSLKDVTINETHDYYAMWIEAVGQKVTIDGLTINSAGRGIKIDEQYVDEPAKVTLNINNAKFTTKNKAAIVVKSVAGAEINASNLNIENVAADTDFAVWVDEDAAAHADKVVVNGALCKVEGSGDVAVGSKEDLPKTDDGTKIDTDFDENVTLLGDITVSASETSANSGYGATGVTVTDGAVLDGKGHTLTVNNANSTWDCVVAAKGGTIKNLTVAGAMRGIFMPGANGDVYIDNVIFKDVVYTFNSDGGNKNYGVYISNSTLNGWTSHSDVHKEVVYTNCNFGEGSGYAYCRPYGPTSFVGCAFEAGFQIDARAAITFENCTFGGVALTTENLATLVTSGTANATVK